MRSWTASKTSSSAGNDAGLHRTSAPGGAAPDHGPPRRGPDGLEDLLSTTLVARRDGRVVGSAALELYGPAALLRSVAVARDLRGCGFGRRLTEAALDLSQRLGVEEAYLLTETAELFFPRFGLRPIPRSEVPHSVRRSVEFTSACPASTLAMVLDLRAV